MKKSKLLLTCIAVLAFVAGSLSFKGSGYFTSGSVYCSTTCSQVQQVAFKIDCVNGVTDQVTNPCAGHTVTLPYYMNANCVCQPTVSGTTKFSSTTDAGN